MKKLRFVPIRGWPKMRSWVMVEKGGRKFPVKILLPALGNYGKKFLVRARKSEPLEEYFAVDLIGVIKSKRDVKRL